MLCTNVVYYSSTFHSKDAAASVAFCGPVFFWQKVLGFLYKVARDGFFTALQFLCSTLA